jgi:hypothetical protein
MELEFSLCLASLGLVEVTGLQSEATHDLSPSDALGVPLACCWLRSLTLLLSCPGHSLHFGLSAPPTASQASAPGVARETHDVF